MAPMSRWLGDFINHDNYRKCKYERKRWMIFAGLVSNKKRSLERLLPFPCGVLQAKKIKSGDLVEKIGLLLMLLEENPTLPETEFLINQLNEKPQSFEVTYEDIRESDSYLMSTMLRIWREERESFDAYGVPIMSRMWREELDSQMCEKEVLEILQVKEILENIKIKEADMKRYLDKTDICNMRDDVTRYLDAQCSREEVRNLLQITDELKDGLIVFFELAVEIKVLIEDLRFLLTFVNDCANKSPDCNPTLLSKITIALLQISSDVTMDFTYDEDFLFGLARAIPSESVVKSIFGAETGVRQRILQELREVSYIKELVAEINDQTLGKKGISSDLFLGRLYQGFLFERVVKEINGLRIGMENSQLEESTSLYNLSQGNSNEMDIVVGIGATVKIAARLIQSSPSGLEILTIVGMAGIGKSTLATKVYSNPIVSSNFDCHAWAQVCEYNQVKNLFYDLLSCVSLRSYAINERSTADIAKHLRSYLKGRRYLIVIDDILSVETWDAVRQFFPNDRNESRIILTTRSMHLATSVNPNNTNYCMKFLDQYQSWEIMKMELFGGKSCPPELLETGKQIAKKCLGQPYAIAYVANLLSYERLRHDWWMFVENSLNSLECRHAQEYEKILSLDVDELVDAWRRLP